MATLSSDVEELIRREMARGTYADENELLRRALEALADRREVVSAVQEGIDDAEAGRMRPWRECMDELRDRKGLANSSLPGYLDVYKGMTDKEIEDLETLILQRVNFPERLSE